MHQTIIPTDRNRVERFLLLQLDQFHIDPAWYQTTHTVSMAVTMRQSVQGTFVPEDLRLTGSPTVM